MEATTLLEHAATAAIAMVLIKFLLSQVTKSLDELTREVRAIRRELNVLTRSVDRSAPAPESSVVTARSARVRASGRPPLEA